MSQLDKEHEYVSIEITIRRGDSEEIYTFYRTGEPEFFPEVETPQSITFSEDLSSYLPARLNGMGIRFKVEHDSNNSYGKVERKTGA